MPLPSLSAWAGVWTVSDEGAAALVCLNSATNDRFSWMAAGKKVGGPPLIVGKSKPARHLTKRTNRRCV